MWLLAPPCRGKNVSGHNTIPPFQLVDTPFWVLESYGKLQQGKGSRPSVVSSRKIKQLTLAVRDHDHPPRAADVAGESTAQLAASASAGAASRAAEAFAELPPSITPPLSSKVVKATTNTLGWQYRTLESLMYFELEQAPPVAQASQELAQGTQQQQQLQPSAAPPAERNAVPTPPLQQQQQESAQEEEGRRAKRQRPDSGDGSAAAFSSSAAVQAPPVAAEHAPCEAHTVPAPEDAALAAIARELLGRIFTTPQDPGNQEQALARVKELLLSEALRGAAGNFQPLKQLRLPEYFWAQPVPQPDKPFAPTLIQWFMLPAVRLLWDLNADIEGVPQVDPKWQLSLLVCVLSTVGAGVFVELLLQRDSVCLATALHRACANTHDSIVRWLVGESLAGLELLQPPPPLDAVGCRRLLIAACTDLRSRYRWMPYHDAARWKRPENVAVVLRTMKREFGLEVVQRMVFPLVENKYFTGASGIATLEAA
ncbi:hypothetical protein FOA52_005512 [Chlamydomonas sp. UWO 241]|nr:hypothetical protein FOA52_005512 [Chlamydomonas sp. UWO 241]